MSAVIQLFPERSRKTLKEVSNHVMTNKKQGFALIYKSIKNAPFYKNVDRKSLWLHLILEAEHDGCEDSFNGNTVTLARGQVLGSAKSIGEACGVSEDSAYRSLQYFKKEGMISVETKEGKRGYTLITLVNYDEYQRGVKRGVSAENGAELKPLPDKAFQGCEAEFGAENSEENSAEALKNNKQINNKNIKRSCAEPSCDDSTLNDALPVEQPVTETKKTDPAPAEPSVIDLPLNTGKSHQVSQEFVSQMESLYPAVNVVQELRAMAGWLLTNPAKRKTSKGVGRFINNWLSRCQDRGGSSGMAPYQAFAKRETQSEKWEAAFKDTSWANDLGDY